MTPEKKKLNRSSATARNAAVKELIANHQEEFEKIHGDIRQDFGLPRTPGTHTKIETLRQQLIAAGIQPLA